MEPTRPQVRFDPSLVQPIDPELQAELNQTLEPGEKLLIRVQNREGAIALAATQMRVIILRATGGYAGVRTTTYPWQSVQRAKQQIGGEVGLIILETATYAGKAETGVRAKLADKTVEKLSGFPVDLIMPVTDKLREVLDIVHPKIQ